MSNKFDPNKLYFSLDEILELPLINHEDSDAKTIREYLRNLLLALWYEGEGFSGKRPFGNSGWENELYLPLVAADLIKGSIDEDGYLDDISSGEIKKANKIIEALILKLTSK